MIHAPQDKELFKLWRKLGSIHKNNGLACITFPDRILGFPEFDEIICILNGNNLEANKFYKVDDLQYNKGLLAISVGEVIGEVGDTKVEKNLLKMTEN